MPFTCSLFSIAAFKNWYLRSYKEIALGPIFWGTDYIKHHTRAVKFPAEPKGATVSVYISIHYLVHLEKRMMSFEKRQNNPVLPMLVFLGDLLLRKKDYE